MLPAIAFWINLKNPLPENFQTHVNPGIGGTEFIQLSVVLHLAKVQRVMVICKQDLSALSIESIRCENIENAVSICTKLQIKQLVYKPSFGSTDEAEVMLRQLEKYQINAYLWLHLTPIHDVLRIYRSSEKINGWVCVEKHQFLDLARQMIQLSGLQPERDIPIQFTGLRPGEKLYEELLIDPRTAAETSHPRLFRSHEPLPAPEVLQQERQRLEDALQQRDSAAALQVMGRLVPEYGVPEHLKQLQVVAAPPRLVSGAPPLQLSRQRPRSALS
jgi:FlaA1/EpsC-like NDP-sugar epimerase